MNYMAWYLTKNYTVIAGIPKLASSSLEHQFRSTRIHPDDCFDWETRIAWVRNPIERLASAYSCFREILAEQGRMPQNKNGDRLNLTVRSLESWEGWVDHVLTEKGIHWKPQHGLLHYEGNFIPTKLLKFDDFSESWDNYIDEPLEHHHMPSRPVEISDYRREELDKKYDLDWNLYLSI